MSTMAMPKLSDTMEEGTVLRWLRADGDVVAKGDPLVEIETDKATMTVEAPEDGVLHIVAAEGDTLDVGQPIAEIGGDGAPDVPDAPTQEIEAVRDDVPAPAPQAPDEQSLATGIPTADDGTAGSIAGVFTPAEVGDATGRPAASPLARGIAARAGIDLATIRGTGPGGRIVKADVEAVLGSSAAAAPAAAAAAPGEPPAPPPPPAPRATG
ncbi:MAG: biotin/lipoyl-containing protein, partial [Miltoncostaeaceae bacterium]